MGHENGIEIGVMEIVAQLKKKKTDELNPTLRLAEDLHIDSIGLLELLADVEERFDFEIGPDDLEPDRFQSIQTLVDYIKERKVV
jgi:acyl carrier protein